MRRRPFLASIGLVPLASAVPAGAQTTWPSKAVRFVNSFPPGGPSDILARMVADALQRQSGQSVIVESRAGAGGNLGADLVAKSAPDGHTLLWGIDTTVTVNPHLYKSMPFRPNELRTLTVVSSSGLLMGVHPKTGVKTARDFVALARSRDLNFSSGGNGSPGHLAVDTLNEAYGTRVGHVPYRGNTPAVLAVVAGEVDGGVLATPGMLPQVKAGKMNALAVTSRTRSRMAPEVPTVAEVGLRELEAEVLYVVMLPAGTPDPLVDAMQRVIGGILARPEFQARLAELDMRFEGLTGAAAQQRLAQLSDRYGRVIRATGMRAD